MKKINKIGKKHKKILKFKFVISYARIFNRNCDRRKVSKYGVKVLLHGNYDSFNDD